MSFDLDASTDPRDALRLIRGHGMTIIGETLYIEGGSYYTGNFTRDENVLGLNEANWKQNDYLFAFDLTQSYNNTDLSVIDSELSITKETSVNSTSGGAILAIPGNSKFVHVGGSPATPSVWYYDNSTGSTSFSTSPAADLNIYDGAAAISATTGVAYYLGGHDSSQTFTSNLVAYDTKLKNSTVVSTLPQGNIYASSMVWLPVGSEGILVNIGGIVTSGGQSTNNPMTKINVYDIASSTWFTQTATAGMASTGVPYDRSWFSAVTPTPNPNQTHWEIIFYGGLNSTNTAQDDIWGLSLPTFQWFRYYDFVNSPFGKANRTSVLVHDTYLAFVDIGPTNVSVATDTQNILSFFDITKDAQGFSSYNASDRGYSTPLSISLQIESDVPAAAGGFATGLQEVFSKTAYNTTSSKSSNHTASHTGAIIGGVVGGTALIIILALLGLFCCRRRRRQSPHEYKSAVPEVPIVEVSASSGWFPQELENNQMNDSNAVKQYQPPVELDANQR